MATNQFGFGAGKLYFTPQVTTPTPIQIGVLQDVTLDLSSEQKELYGEYMMPLDVASAKRKINLKAKYAMIDVRAAYAIFGGTLATGSNSIANNEAGSVPASSTYTVTVANSTTWVQDLGVRYSLTGKNLTPVASAPAAGQYTVAAGVYTFASADASAALLFDYEYTVAGTGVTWNLGNPLMGATPIFQAQFKQTLRGPNPGNQVVTIWAMTATKFSLPTKLDDYVMHDFEAGGFADSAGRTVTWSQSPG